MARTFNWNLMPEVNRPASVKRGRRGPQVMDKGTHTRKWASYVTATYEGVERTINGGHASTDGVARTLNRKA